MGDDFDYTNSKMWFSNLDKLINHINSKVVFKRPLNFRTDLENLFLYERGILADHFLLLHHLLKV